MIKKFFLILFFIPLLLATKQVSACAVCFDAQDGSREAYYIITVLLSVLPITIIALIGFWIKKNIGRQN